MNLRFSAAALGCLLACASGCLPTSPGELQNGGFTYDCTGSSDLQCDDSLFDASRLPQAIAVGAPFGLQYSGELPEDDRGNSIPVQLVAADPSILDGDSRGFRFLAPGTSALLARTASGTVVDFAHLTGAAIASVAVTDSLGAPADHVSLGFSAVTLVARPESERGDTLAGAVDYAWTSSDESIVSLSSGWNANEASLIGGKPGQATVTVKVGDTSASITVTVGGST